VGGEGVLVRVWGNCGRGLRGVGVRSLGIGMRREGIDDDDDGDVA
jgi:hypothetical protein